MSELVTFGETALRLSPPGSDRLETTDSLEVWATGAASNVAIAAQRLGTAATWTSKLADTPLGHRAVAELRGHGITTDLTWVEEGRQGLRFLERGVEPRENVVLEDREGTAIASAEPGDLPMDVMQDASAVFASGETIGRSETVAETAGALLRATDGQAVLGIDYRQDLWSREAAREQLTDLFTAVDVLILNEREGRNVLDKSGEAREIAHGIGAEWEFDSVVVTKSDRGALVWHDATIHEREAVQTDAIDVSGQHDAFTGAFVGRRLAGDDVGTALAHGVAAAALARTVPGPIPTIDRSAVERVVDAMDGSGRSGAGGPVR